MKQRDWIRGALTGLVLLLALGGCRSEKAQEPPSEAANADSAADSAAVATLEETLLREREERYISESAYKAEIKRLQAELAAKEVVAAPSAGAPEALTFHYRVENGEATVTGYGGSATILTVPATLDGHPVTAIGERAFEGAEVAAVTLPEGIRDVGWFAFYNCRSLVSVTLPNSVGSIGYAVFDGCAKVTICCPEGSYAARYAASYGLSCVYT